MSARCRPGIIAVGINATVAGCFFGIEREAQVPHAIWAMAPGAWWWCRSLQDTQIIGINTDSGHPSLVRRGAFVRLPDSWLQPIGDAPAAQVLERELEAA